MNSEQVCAKLFPIFEANWCKENIHSSQILFDKKIISKQDLQSIKQDFEAYFVEYNSFGDKSEETISQLQKAIEELTYIGNSIENNERDESESEPKKFNVCSSSVFKKENIQTSNWSPKNIVGLDFSYTKSYQISPDIRTGSEENEVAALSLVYKWKGLRSNIQPLSIPISPKEFEQYLLGGIVMFSIFEPRDRGFPKCPQDPLSCKELLSEVEDWTAMGQHVLESFKITPENIGTILRSHLLDIAHSSQEVQQDMESMKPIKKKKAEEFMADIWSKRKKAYLKNLENSDK